MWKLLKRWYVWLGLFFVLGLAASAGMILANPSRVNQENFDRIRDGTTEEDVIGILGEGITEPPLSLDLWTETIYWENGPDVIRVKFDVTDTPRSTEVFRKSFHLATPWETLQWYAKKGAAKIGVKWD
jgi:hypothetical protein